MHLPYRVIDADGHVDEKAVNWVELVPERYRQDAPTWVTYPDGRKHLMIEGKPWPSRHDFYGQLGMWPEPRKPKHMWGWDREGMQNSQQMPWQTRDPLDWLKSENCFYAVEPEETTIAYVAQMVGEDRLVYASDYSHWDCLCPDSVKVLNERPDLSNKLKRKLFGENAARLFNL